MRNTPRPAPMSFRPTAEHKRLIDAALKITGIRKTGYGWFPLLITEVLTHYIATANEKGIQK